MIDFGVLKMATLGNVNSHPREMYRCRNGKDFMFVCAEGASCTKTGDDFPLQRLTAKHNGASEGVGRYNNGIRLINDVSVRLYRNTEYTPASSATISAHPGTPDKSSCTTKLPL